MPIQIGILRHAIAEDTASSGSDFDRRLTRSGASELQEHIDLLERWAWAPSVIFHSPYVRTTQTAHIVASRFEAVPALPTDLIVHGRPDEILRLCVGHPAPLLIGHEPTMGELISHLLGAPPGATPLARAGFALLDVDRLPTTRPARLILFVPPRLVSTQE